VWSAAAARSEVLHQRRQGRSTALLVRGLDVSYGDVQVLFGVDTNGDRRIDEHVTADAVADWRSVVAVRVSLLLGSTENNIVDEPQPVFFNGVLQTPTDRRLRQVMTTTIALRNRMP